MKKDLLILAIVMVAAACGGDDSSDSATTTPGATPTTAADTPEPTLAPTTQADNSDGAPAATAPSPWARGHDMAPGQERAIRLLSQGPPSHQIEMVEGARMKIDELRTLLEDLPSDTLLTVATSPYDIWPVLDVRVNRDDSREDLCAACEVVFLAGDAWEDEDPDDFDLTAAT